MSKRRHIKFWRYYKEWIETYKDGQIQDVTYAKYLMVQKQIKNLVPDLYLDEMTRRDVQRLINKYGETHERITVLDFLHHIQAPLRDAVYEGWIAKDPTYKVVATSHELSTVFQYSFMRYSLGVNYDSFSKKYIIRTQGGESFNADGSTKIVYLGFGEWKNERGDIDGY